jgi:metal-responsive CopG/Arc/MetJ family transcriptional regulator
MPVEKLSISLPDSLAASIDRYAALDGVTRSFLIQEAAARYVAVRDAAGREQARREGVDAALAGFDRIAQEWGDDSRLGVDYLAEIRGEATDLADASDE